MKTYLFFGSFNPFHNGHHALARHILDHTSSDLWFVVSPQNPHKDPAILAPFLHRYAMVKMVADTFGERVQVSDIESRMPLPSYTFNTVSRLNETYPERKFSIIAGSDIAGTIHTWYRYDELVKIVDVAIYPRLDSERNLCSPEFRDAPVTQFSSTEFRNTKDFTGIPVEVASYITKHHLYGF